MTGFSLPRVALPATLRLTAGERRRGQIYVMDRGPQHTGPETPLEMLNRAEGFFPFRPENDAGGGNSVLLVTKARTVALSVPRDAAAQDPARLSAAKQARIELTLADGSTLMGWATVELPEHHSRLLDYLNASPGPFFAVTTDEAVHFVNRAHVLYARPQE
jgi:hypothetical protein